MLPRSKSSLITVRTDRFRYVVSESGDSNYTEVPFEVPLFITVQHENTNGAMLRVLGLTSIRFPQMESRCYMGRTLSRGVKPSHIASLIELALQRGWNPNSAGPPFSMQVRDVDVFDKSEQQ